MRDSQEEVPFENTVIVIDGPNLYSSVRALNWAMDFKKLIPYFEHCYGRVVRALYYTAVNESDEFQSIRPLIDWLDYNGYRVITKPTKAFPDGEGRMRVKGNMDIEIAVDMMELSASPNIDHFVLMSGDGDFRSLIEAVQRRGKRVTVVSTIKSQPSWCADELRRQADAFVELSDIMQFVSKPLRQFVA